MGPNHPAARRGTAGGVAMAARTNKHGLTDDIPEPIARRIRQECGFGCVLCGMAVAQYEHFDPPFAEATEHAAHGIALLCGSCHDRKTRGRLSVDAIRKGRAAPLTFKNGASREAFEIHGWPTITVGSNTFANCKAPILHVDTNERLFYVEPPEAAGAPYRLSATFRDDRGREVARIVENIWHGDPRAWDIECVGQRFTIRAGPRQIVLRLVTKPGEGVEVERLHMLFGDGRRGLKVDDRRLLLFEVGRPGVELKDIDVDGFDVGIRV
jgi:hypothetical protein